MDWFDPAGLTLGYAIFLRAGAFIFLMPIFSRPVPIMVRTAASLFTAILLVSIIEPQPGLFAPDHILELLLLSIKELLIGALMGFAVQLVFYLCHFAGQFISMEIGLMQSNLFNPLTKASDTVLSTGMTMLVVVLIFSLDIHHMIIYAFIRSFEILPVGSAIGSTLINDRLVWGVGKIFILGVQMAAPLIAVNYIVTLSFAILGRAVPNMNVLILSFGVRIGVGFIVLVMVFVVIMQILIGMIYDSPERMLQFLPFS